MSNRLEDRGDVRLILPKAHIGARGDDNSIIAIGSEKNKRDATCFFLVNNGEPGIYAVCLQCFDEPFAERIAADTTCHCNCCTQARHCHCLVRSLPTWNEFKRACPKERFAQLGDVRDAYNLIHVETTKNENGIL